MAIKLPQKPRPGFHSINELTRAVNGIIDYISSFSLTGKSPIRVVQDMFSAKISIDRENTDSDYRGYFKVIADGNTVQVVDGTYQNNDYAGYAYYNASAVHCPVGSIAAENGYLCLQISSDVNFRVNYVFREDVPDMPHLEDAGGDNTAEYPLAWVTDGADGWEVQQLCYGLPQLWCFGPCDSGEESSE